MTTESSLNGEWKEFLVIILIQRVGGLKVKRGGCKQKVHTVESPPRLLAAAEKSAPPGLGAGPFFFATPLPRAVPEVNDLPILPPR